MKIIFDNIIYSLQKAGGISMYWAELTKRALSNDVLFYEQKNENIFRRDLKIPTIGESPIPSSILRYLPFFRKLPTDSIFHSSYYRSAIQRNITNIITVYDFTYEKYRSGPARALHSWQKYNAINKADGVICISNNTRDDLYEFMPDLDRGKVKTIYISADDDFFQIKDSMLSVVSSKFNQLTDKKIILFVGDRMSRYKNFKLAVEAVEALKEFVLVSVGSGPITNHEKTFIDKKIGKRFYHFRSISKSELNILYNISYCLLYPSSYEGFGIPILEAMRAGCPVVTTNSSSIPEVAGNAAILLNEIKTSSFVNSIYSLDNKSYSEDLIQKGLLQSRKFSWDKCFKETFEFYETIVNRNTQK